MNVGRFLSGTMSRQSGWRKRWQLARRTGYARFSLNTGARRSNPPGTPRRAGRHPTPQGGESLNGYSGCVCAIPRHRWSNAALGAICVFAGPLDGFSCRPPPRPVKKPGPVIHQTESDVQGGLVNPALSTLISAWRLVESSWSVATASISQANTRGQPLPLQESRVRWTSRNGCVTSRRFRD